MNLLLQKSTLQFQNQRAGLDLQRAACTAHAINKSKIYIMTHFLNSFLLPKLPKTYYEKGAGFDIVRQYARGNGGCKSSGSNANANGQRWSSALSLGLAGERVSLQTLQSRFLELLQLRAFNLMPFFKQGRVFGKLIRARRRTAYYIF